MRQRGRFAGFSLYVSNTTERNMGYLCYKDGPELPPLDFNITCRTYGRYVTYYNERLPGTTYPEGYEKSNVIAELCEVTVKGCSDLGVYGRNCDQPCPDNCQERRCDIISGTCLGCTHGWLGEYCNETCPSGYHGLECELKCAGHCKYNDSCNHITGFCDKGCFDGWIGENCTEQCPTGTFGSDCVHNCSGNCLSDVTCNITTGMCDKGCKPGYTGKSCDPVCSGFGVYGSHCDLPCPKNCKEHRCDIINGTCFGCTPGWMGKYCSIGCTPGYYGPKCESKCVGHCKDNEPCNHINGLCDNECNDGWSGENCTEECQTGTFGPDCGYNCSGHCLGDIPCNTTTGRCDSGCKPGYTGELCDTANLQSNECNESFYITGMSILVIITIILGAACILLFWKYKRLVKIVRSLHYTSITRTSLQLENSGKDGPQYEEIRVTENSYNNTELRI